MGREGARERLRLCGLDRLLRRSQGETYLARLSPAQRLVRPDERRALRGLRHPAARALLLDASPLGGFDKATVDTASFAHQARKSVLLLKIGHGGGAKLLPRNPRMSCRTQRARVRQHTLPIRHKVTVRTSSLVRDCAVTSENLA